MAFNKLNGTAVGADLSRPAPIYRPLVDFPLSQNGKIHNQLRITALDFLLIKIGSRNEKFQW
jgi:hypothetical protein